MVDRCIGKHPYFDLNIRRIRRGFDHELVYGQCRKRNGHGPGGKYCREHAWKDFGYKPTPFWRRWFKKRRRDG